jgi:hypothetical protein
MQKAGMKCLLNALSAALLWLSAGCATMPAGAPDQAVEPDPAAAFEALLPNAIYAIDVTKSGYAPLTNGVYEEAIMPGSASKTSVRLGVPKAVGDLNGDGEPDAAVVLVAQIGGAGTFFYLAALLNEEGRPRALPALLVGDRVVVESVVIQRSRIYVNMQSRAPDQSISEAPGVKARKEFRVWQRQLVPAGETVSAL